MQDSTKVTWGQVYQDFKGALSGAADALKTGSEHVYEVLVRQQVINSITYCLIVGVVLSCGIILLWKGLKWVKDDDGEWDWYNDSPGLAFVIIGAVFCVIGISTFTALAGDIIMGFLNPEYGAIQEIRKFIR